MSVKFRCNFTYKINVNKFNVNILLDIINKLSYTDDMKSYIVPFSNTLFDVHFSAYENECVVELLIDKEEFDGMKEFNLQMNVFHKNELFCSETIMKDIIKGIGIDNITRLEFIDEGYFP